MGERIRVIDTVDDDYSLPGQPAHGLILASTRFSTDCKAGEEPAVDVVHFSAWNAGVTLGEIPLTGPADKRDFQDPPGYLIVREANAGEHDFRYIDIGGQRRQMVTRIPFTVEEGKAVYLGEIHMRYTNCYGRPSATIQVKDEWERDRQLFEKKLKNLRSGDVIKRVLPSNWR